MDLNNFVVGREVFEQPDLTEIWESIVPSDRVDLIQEAIEKLDVLSGTLVEAEQKMENARLMLEQCLNHIQEQEKRLDEYSNLEYRVKDLESKVQSLELHNMKF